MSLYKNIKHVLKDLVGYIRRKFGMDGAARGGHMVRKTATLHLISYGAQEVFITGNLNLKKR